MPSKITWPVRFVSWCYRTYWEKVLTVPVRLRNLISISEVMLSWGNVLSAEITVQMFFQKFGHTLRL